MQEDAFINFRVISNLLAGHGPVFNIGERIEAYSDPLWLFVLAALHGMLPFVSLEWLSVVLGLGGVTGGVVFGGRAIQRLGGSRGDGLLLPVGLLVFSVVAGVWEFSTSGLEMGMVFCWIGLTFWLLVRTEARRNSALWCAFIAGLGPLLRPELILMSGVFLAGLAVVVASPGWAGPTSVWRRYLVPLLAAVFLPVLYELWRMAYFALLVPNTGLAKSGTSSWWSQGFTYLWNFVSPYTLWLPLTLAVPLVVPRIRRWWSRGDRTGVVVLLTPVVAALADTLYVVHVGGDYMHARLLLPAFLSLCLVLYVGVVQLRSLLVVPLIGIVIWSVVCAGWLRWDPGALFGPAFSAVHGIDNERSFSIYVAKSPHPITTTDWYSSQRQRCRTATVACPHFTSTGDDYRQTAAIAAQRGEQVMLVVTNRLQTWIPQDIRAARSSLPFHMAVNLTNIGFVGYVSGPQVYIFDALSLANPIGSHINDLVRQARPGANKIIGPAWMVGRLGVPGEALPAGAPSAQSIVAARRALTCPPLSSYLRAITGPMSISQGLSNITHSIKYTTMTFSSDPTRAAQELCR